MPVTADCSTHSDVGEDSADQEEEQPWLTIDNIAGRVVRPAGRHTEQDHENRNLAGA